MTTCSDAPFHSSSFLGRRPVLPKLHLSESLLVFELTPEGERTGEQTFVVTNTGSRVAIRSILLAGNADGNDDADFVLVDRGDYPEFLLTNQEFTVAVDFTARIDGIATGSVLIHTDEDRLPYSVSLKSRTQRNAVYGSLYEDLLARLASEQGARVAGDQAEASSRRSLNLSLRSLIDLTRDTEIAARSAVDNAILVRLGQLEAVNAGGGAGNPNGTWVDQYARSMILQEITHRETADMSEVTARLLLGSSFTTSLGITNAKLNDEILLRTTAYEASIRRFESIEASYQNAGQVDAIATARVQTEQAARVTAVSAEASNRTILAATLRTETDDKLRQEVINRQALISSEQSLRIAGDATNVVSMENLTARTSGGRGLTPNATFEARGSGWSGSLSYVSAPDGSITAQSAVGQYNLIYSANTIPVDTNRVYQVVADVVGLGAPISVYVGVRCYSDTGTHLGNIYSPVANGQMLSGLITVNSYLTGEATYPVPTFRAGNTFPAGTRKIALVALLNYPNPTAVPGGWGKIIDFWLEDITGSYAASAAVTQEKILRISAIAAEALRVDTILVSYATTAAMTQAIQQSKTDVLTTVNGAYVTKTELAQADYRSGIQVTSAVNQGKSEVLATVSQGYVSNTTLQAANYQSGAQVSSSITASKTDILTTVAGFGYQNNNQVTATATNAANQAKNEALQAVANAYVTLTGLAAANLQNAAQVAATVTSAVNQSRTDTLSTVAGAYVANATLAAANFQSGSQVSSAVNQAKSDVLATVSGTYATIVGLASLNYQNADQVANSVYNATTTLRSDISGSYATKQEIIQAGYVNAQGAATVAAGQIASALAPINGKLQANLVLFADAGNGRAQIGIQSDAYGNAGIDFVGDARFHGGVVIDGTLNVGNKAIDGSVTAPKLGNGAVQTAYFYSTASDISIPRGQTANIASIVFNKTSSDTLLEVQFFSNLMSQDDIQFMGAFYLDGSAVQYCRANIILDRTNSNGQMPITPFAFISSSGAGQHTLDFNMTNYETDNVNLTILAGSTLKLVEYQRAAGAIVSGTSNGIVTVPGGGVGGGGGGGGGGGTNFN